ncbi:HAMP domain-containing histidine kinase [Sulfurimonas sp.]|nr:HAMP domain-containing histidine kinase [Sulfurimonas sp.]
MISIDKFFTSSRAFDESQRELKNRYQMLNIALLLSSTAFMLGIIVNTINGIELLALVEAILLVINVVLIFILRKYKNSSNLVTTILTAQCTMLMILIIYTSSAEEMKHVWIFTYPIVLLYFQSRLNSLYWFVFLTSMILIAPLQSFIEINYSVFQSVYIVVVLIIISVIVNFYKIKMNAARDVILKQQASLQDFNINLEKQVDIQTSELIELNENLAIKVQEKIDELVQKDKILTLQSKQAVMGEMISMIAHQWRQPLSTITLQISNLQVKKLLGKNIDDSEIDKSLSDISDTILYLSDTVDDFQTYFSQDKDMVEVNIHDLVQKALNLLEVRIKQAGIKTTIIGSSEINVNTYFNELLQVILNIFNNAIDAIESIDETNGLIDIRVEIEKKLLVIKIKDNGGGIEDNNLIKLFEPYFSTKGKNGTGLGLYMCQMLVQKQLNGEVLVTSDKPYTTFTLKLPIYE